MAAWSLGMGTSKAAPSDILLRSIVSKYSERAAKRNLSASGSAAAKNHVSTAIFHLKNMCHTPIFIHLQFIFIYFHPFWVWKHGFDRCLQARLQGAAIH